MKPFVLSDDLWCGWQSWRVGDDHTLLLEVPHNHCTDMSGCIRVAKTLMPEVSRIIVVAGGEQDIVYEYDRDGFGQPEWVAFDMRRIVGK